MAGAEGGKEMSGLKYRHEYKYQVTTAQARIIETRADAVLRRDSHVCRDGPYSGAYNIRSVYFDDMAHTAFWENECGTDPREKFRIRIYNHNDSRITLELKSKQAGLCLKQSCPLTREQCEILVSGGCLPDDENYPPMLQKLLIQIRTRRLRPVVVVEYERIPFTYPLGNVRVTLDSGLRFSGRCEQFLNGQLPLQPVMPAGQLILEVKWDELLPDFIYRALMVESLQWSSFSKFYLCMKLLSKST